MATSVAVTGADVAARSLHHAGERALDQTETFTREGRRVQRQITGIPRVTGRLERGVRGGSKESILRATRTGYTIATAVPYARFVFRGPSKMAARPPRIPHGIDQAAAAAVGRDVTHDRG